MYTMYINTCNTKTRNSKLKKLQTIVICFYQEPTLLVEFFNLEIFKFYNLKHNFLF